MTAEQLASRRVREKVILALLGTTILTEDAVAIAEALICCVRPGVSGQVLRIPLELEDGAGQREEVDKSIGVDNG